MQVYKSKGCRRNCSGNLLSVFFHEIYLSLIKILLMDNYQPHLRKTVSYYQLLLQRYARRFVQDDNLSAKIVEEVLECQYNINSLVPCKHLRHVLKTDVLNKCYYHIQAIIFGQEITNKPLPNRLKRIIETGKTETK